MAKEAITQGNHYAAQLHQDWVVAVDLTGNYWQGDLADYLWGLFVKMPVRVSGDRLRCWRRGERLSWAGVG